MHVGPTAPPDATGARTAPVTRPRPGHADLAGALKYERDDMRDILERASARETTMRVAAGALARQLLARFGVDVVSHVFRIGPVGTSDPLGVTLRGCEADSRATRRCTAPTARPRRG